MVPRSVSMNFKSGISVASCRLLSARRALGVAAVPEIKLLDVGALEGPHAKELDGDDGRACRQAQVDRGEGEVSRLQAVRERHKDEVAESKHEAETVRGDVHLVQDRRLRVSIIRPGDIGQCTSSQSESSEYHPWKSTTRIMLSVTRPLRRYCSHAQAMLSSAQPMIPGRTSLKVLRSKLGKPGKVGLSGRPRNHYDQLDSRSDW